MHTQPVFAARSATPICPFFYECGGCDTQDVTYAEQLRAKQEWMELLFAPLLLDSTECLPIIGSPDECPTYFRNKIRFSFLRDESGHVSPSRHRKGSTSSDIAVDDCFLQSPESMQIVRYVAEWAEKQNWTLYDPKTKQGWLRHLLIRQSKHTGEILISTVSDTQSVPGESEWVTAITQAFPNITSLYHSRSYPLQPTKIDTRLLAGKEKMAEKIGDYRCVVSPHAFFQTNGSMVETLYSEALRQAGSGEILWDLYAGSATIGIFASAKFQKIISIEQNPSNIADAQENIALNNLENIVPVPGTVEAVLTSSFYRQHGPADVILIDPPRAGIHPTLRTIIPNMVKQGNTTRLVYVSCNPATALRDCAAFSQAGLAITSFRPIDMFPHSLHCELVMTLEASRA